MTPFSEVRRARASGWAAFTIIEALAMLVAIGILAWILLAIVRHEGIGPFSAVDAAGPSGTATEMHQDHGPVVDPSTQGKVGP